MENPEEKLLCTPRKSNSIFETENGDSRCSNVNHCETINKTMIPSNVGALLTI